MKKLLASLLSLALVFSLAACQSTGSNETKTPGTAPVTDSKEPSGTTPAGEINYLDVNYWSGLSPEDMVSWVPQNAVTKKVGLIVPDSTNEFYNDVATTATGIFADAGYELNWDGINGDPTRGINDIETWIVQGVDAIVVMAQDNSMDLALKKAMEAGVLVVSASAQVEYYHHWLLQDNYEMGVAVAEMAAKWKQEHYGDEPVQYFTVMNQANQAVIEKSNGVIEKLTELLPNCENVGAIQFSTMEQFSSDVETLMTKYPDIKFFAGMHNAFALTVLETAKTLDKATKDEFAVFGASLSAQTLEELKNQDSCYEGEIWMGDQGRQLALNTIGLLEGKEYPRYFYALNFPITHDNVTTYYDDYYEQLDAAQ